jgi:hypothetical protein
LPDHQSFQREPSAPPCTPPNEDGTLESRASPDAQEFIKDYRGLAAKSILVGMGDNFGPYYYARAFSPAPPEQLTHPGKELYEWSEHDHQWYFYTGTPKETKRLLRQGWGTIPTDNVGCFLSYVHYDPIVPGKHDFYYGPKRLRQLARFLASLPKEKEDKKGANEFSAVQMLAANLVMKTSWASDHKPVPDSGKGPLPFTTRYVPPKGPPDDKKTGDRPSLTIEDFTDEGFTYPWMQFVEVTAKNWKASDSPHVFVCKADDGDPDRFDEKAGCKRLDPAPAGSDEPAPATAEKIKPALSGGGDRTSPSAPAPDPKAGDEVIFRYRIPDSSRLIPGKNYFICIPAAQQVASVGNSPDQDGCGSNLKAGKKPYVFRFSVYEPFFQFPFDGWPNTSHSRSTGQYKDPDLYVVKELNGTPVVIFGVVDQDLRQHVGGDNFAWKNVSDDTSSRDRLYNTEIAIGKPVLALQQLNDYFEQQHPGFRGIRILLAQMSPDAARVTAQHLPKSVRFDVVITGADDALATPNQSVESSPPLCRRTPTFPQPGTKTPPGRLPSRLATSRFRPRIRTPTSLLSCNVPRTSPTVPRKRRSA